MIKIVEEGSEKQKNWEAFFHEGFCLVIRPGAKRLIATRSSLPIEFESHFQVLIGVQIKGKATTTQTSEEEYKTSNTRKHKTEETDAESTEEDADTMKGS